MSTDIEVNDSPYPDSVKAGIPKLSPTPKGWEKAPLKKYLYEVRRPAKLKNEDKYKLVTVKRSRGGAEEREWLTGKQIKTKTQFFVEEGDFLISKRQIVHGACAIVPKELHGAVVSNEYCILHSNGGIDIGFLNYLSHTLYFQQTCFHSSIGVHVEKMIFRQNKWLDWEFNIPPIKEQKEIVNILTAIDQLIIKLEESIKFKNSQKSALMRQLLTGKQRLHGFNGKWEKVKLGEVLEYEQPTKYLVKSKKYNASNITPVLTANKAFILGYTNETSGIFNNLPVIIFDDFTTASKFVNFPFKVKSSAIKILRPKQAHADLLFIYKNMQLIDFPLSDHQRYWISEYQNIEIPWPSTEEQRSITAVLSAVDREIDQLTQKLDAYKQQKKGLMQQLLTGKKRVGIAKSEAA